MRKPSSSEGGFFCARESHIARESDSLPGKPFVIDTREIFSQAFLLLSAPGLSDFSPYFCWYELRRTTASPGG